MCPNIPRSVIQWIYAKASPLVGLSNFPTSPFFFLPTLVGQHIPRIEIYYSRLGRLLPLVLGQEHNGWFALLATWLASNLVLAVGANVIHMLTDASDVGQQTTN